MAGQRRTNSSNHTKIAYRPKTGRRYSILQKVGIFESPHLCHGIQERKRVIIKYLITSLKGNPLVRKYIQQ